MDLLPLSVASDAASFYNQLNKEIEGLKKKVDDKLREMIAVGENELGALNSALKEFMIDETLADKVINKFPVPSTSQVGSKPPSLLGKSKGLSEGPISPTESDVTERVDNLYKRKSARRGKRILGSNQAKLIGIIKNDPLPEADEEDTVESCEEENINISSREKNGVERETTQGVVSHKSKAATSRPTPRPSPDQAKTSPYKKRESRKIASSKSVQAVHGEGRVTHNISQVRGLETINRQSVEKRIEERKRRIKATQMEATAGARNHHAQNAPNAQKPSHPPNQGHSFSEVVPVVKAVETRAEDPEASYQTNDENQQPIVVLDDESVDDEKTVEVISLEHYESDEEAYEQHAQATDEESYESNVQVIDVEELDESFLSEGAPYEPINLVTSTSDIDFLLDPPEMETSLWEIKDSMEVSADDEELSNDLSMEIQTDGLPPLEAGYSWNSHRSENKTKDKVPDTQGQKQTIDFSESKDAKDVDTLDGEADPSNEEVKSDCLSKEELKSDDVSKEELKSDGLSEEELKSDDLSKEKLKTGGLSKERPKTDGLSNVGPTTGGISKEEPKTGGSSKEEPKTGGTLEEEPRRDGISKEEPKKDAPSRKETKSGGLSEEEGKKDESVNVEEKKGEFCNQEKRDDLSKDEEKKELKKVELSSIEKTAISPNQATTPEIKVGTQQNRAPTPEMTPETQKDRAPTSEMISGIDINRAPTPEKDPTSQQSKAPTPEMGRTPTPEMTTGIQVNRATPETSPATPENRVQMPETNPATQENRAPTPEMNPAGRNNFSTQHPGAQESKVEEDSIHKDIKSFPPVQDGIEKPSPERPRRRVTKKSTTVDAIKSLNKDPADRAVVSSRLSNPTEDRRTNFSMIPKENDISSRSDPSNQVSPVSEPHSHAQRDLVGSTGQISKKGVDNEKAEIMKRYLLISKKSRAEEKLLSKEISGLKSRQKSVGKLQPPVAEFIINPDVESDSTDDLDMDGASHHELRMRRKRERFQSVSLDIGVKVEPTQGDKKDDSRRRKKFPEQEAVASSLRKTWSSLPTPQASNRKSSEADFSSKQDRSFRSTDANEQPKQLAPLAESEQSHPRRNTAFAVLQRTASWLSGATEESPNYVRPVAKRATSEPEVAKDLSKNLSSDSDLVMLEQVQSKPITDPYGDGGRYTGIMVSGKPYGQGMMKYNDGRVYSGEWHSGRWHGHGHAVFANRDSYVGQYEKDQRHGRGRYEWADGRVYDGDFEMDQRQGYGTYTWPDGAVYSGQFHKGLRHGKGRYSFADGSVYTGDWEGGKYHGVGECVWADGRRYRGQWQHGQAHGHGVEHRADGRVRHEGEWKEDRPVRRRRAAP